MMSLAMMVGLIQIASEATMAVTLGEVRRWNKFDAAAGVLPPDAADQVIDGRFSPSGPPGLYFGSWWFGPAVHSEDFCQRAAYHATVRPRVWVDRSDRSTMSVSVTPYTQYAPTYAAPATPSTCAEAKGWINTTPEDVDAKVWVLRRLMWAMSIAKAEGTLPFEVSIECTDDGSASCPEARAALRNLPLGSLYDVRPPREPRQTPARVASQAGTRTSASPLYSVAEIAFGPSETYASWFVTLRGDDTIESMTLQRVVVIYH